jgi:aldehyde dehydrogenase (NAD+)
MGALPLKHPDKLYIGGAFVRPANEDTEAILNPATEEVLGFAPVGELGEVDQAIAAAREAFDHGPWRRMGSTARAAHLQRFHDELMARKPAIVSLLIREAGATAMLADFGQFEFPMKHLRYAIEVCQRDHTVTFPPVISRNLAGGLTVNTTVVERDPVGVVAAITAYNYPFSLAIFKVAAALAMGNTLVLKPSQFTPFSTLAIAEAADAAGLPHGVLNVVTGGVEVGTMLTTDPRVDMVSFTGSDAVGSAIMAQAAGTMKRVLLELGGKSALVIREDADLEKAVSAGVFSFTSHAGQGCSLTTRHIVHNDIRKRYVERVAEVVRGLKIGDPSDASVQLGPLIRASQRERVERYVQIGVKGGARIAAGGARPQALERGFFFEPTVLDDVDNGSAVAQDEIFGPVAVVMGFDTDEEAVTLANQSRYGLGGAVYSRNVGQAYEIARQIQTGAVHVNCMPAGSNLNASMGGVKRSGIGRELGIEGLYAYTQSKTLTLEAG